MPAAPTPGASIGTWGSENNAWVGTSLDQTTGNLKLSALNAAFLGNNLTVGSISLPNAGWLAARNAANSADINMLRVDSSNRLELGAQLYRNDGGSFGESGSFVKLHRVIPNPTTNGTVSSDLFVEAKGTATVAEINTGYRAYMADASTVVNKTITGATNASPIVITATAHGFANGDAVAVYGVVGNTAANGKWVVANATANTFELAGSTGNGAYTSGGTATNRPGLYGYMSNIAPAVSRGSLTGTAANADDANNYIGYNNGPGKGTDAFYLANNPSFGTNSAYVTGFFFGANCDSAARFPSTFSNSVLNLTEVVSSPYGLDMQGGTFTSGAIRLPNTGTILARNAANSANLTVITTNAANEVILGATSQGNIAIAANNALRMGDPVNIQIGTTTGTKIGTATNQKLAFWNKTPVVQPSAYSTTNVTPDRTYDANATSIDELADVLGTLIADLQTVGLVG